MITAINTRAVSMMRYTAPFVDWRKDELKEIDWDTCKMMNMYRALHPEIVWQDSTYSVKKEDEGL